MTKSFKLGFIIAVFAVMTGFSQNASAQMVGGFKAAPVDDKGVVAAANFAVKSIGESEQMDLTLDSILTAEYQVVAGKNYKLFFKTSYADGGEVYDLCITAKVFHSLKNTYTLSEWDSQECPQ